MIVIPFEISSTASRMPRIEAADAGKLLKIMTSWITDSAPLSSTSQKAGVWRNEVNGLPLHAGAERYYRERGWLN